MLKPIPKTDITVRPFPTYKRWNFKVENELPEILPLLMYDGETALGVFDDRKTSQLVNDKFAQHHRFINEYDTVTREETRIGDGVWPWPSGLMVLIGNIWWIFEYTWGDFVGLNAYPYNIETSTLGDPITIDYEGDIPEYFTQVLYDEENSKLIFYHLWSTVPNRIVFSLDYPTFDNFTQTVHSEWNGSPINVNRVRWDSSITSGTYLRRGSALANGKVYNASTAPYIYSFSTTTLEMVSEIKLFDEDSLEYQARCAFYAKDKNTVLIGTRSGSVKNGTIFKIDPETDTVVGSIEVNSQIDAISYWEKYNMIIAASFKGDQLNGLNSVMYLINFDTSEVIQTISLNMLGIDPERFWANSSFNEVNQIKIMESKDEVIFTDQFLNGLPFGSSTGVGQYVIHFKIPNFDELHPLYDGYGLVTPNFEFYNNNVGINVTYTNKNNTSGEIDDVEFDLGNKDDDFMLNMKLNIIGYANLVQNSNAIINQSNHVLLDAPENKIYLWIYKTPIGKYYVFYNTVFGIRNATFDLTNTECEHEFSLKPFGIFGTDGDFRYVPYEIYKHNIEEAKRFYTDYLNGEFNRIQIYYRDIERTRPNIFTVKTDNTGASADDSFFVSPLAINDETSIVETSETIRRNARNHTVSWEVAGIYDVKIFGTIRRHGYGFGGANPVGNDRAKFLDVKQWGDATWLSQTSPVDTSDFYGYFVNNVNLVVTAEDAPIFEENFNCTQFFRNCNSLTNEDFSHWDMSNVKYMRGMFRSANSFNGNISNWDVSNVETFNDMFNGAFAFNQDLGGWDIGSATTMANMFDSSGMSVENYSRTLIGWANYVFENGAPFSITLGASGRQYNDVNYGGTEFTNAVDARNYLTTTAGWTITDSGLAT